MKFTRKSQIISVLILIGLLAFMIYEFRSPAYDQQHDFFSDPSVRLHGPELPQTVGPMPKLPWLSPQPQSSEVLKIPKNDQVESEKLKNLLSRIAKIDMPFPKDMIFKEIDLDPNMLAISGIDFKKSTNLTLIARHGTVSAGDVLPFLKESVKLIPNLGPEVLDKFPAPDRLDINPNNGLIDNTLWEIKTETMWYYFLFANRKDGAGSYLAIFSGPSHGVDMASPEMFKISDEIKAVE